MTYQEILNTYGHPDQVHPGESGMVWGYDSANSTVWFRFIDGLVADLFYRSK